MLVQLWELPKTAAERAELQPGRWTIVGGGTARDVHGRIGRSPLMTSHPLFKIELQGRMTVNFISIHIKDNLLRDLQQGVPK